MFFSKKTKDIMTDERLDSVAIITDGNGRWATKRGKLRSDGHIEGAIMIPEYEIAKRAEKELPDKDALILVYCRSGRRSKIASEELARLGYTNVKEFGGIIDWPYEIVK